MNVAFWILVWVAVSALVWTAWAAVLLRWHGGRRRRLWRFALAGVAGAASGGIAVLAEPVVGGLAYFGACLVPAALMSYRPDQHSAFVWWKRRLRRRGGELNPFWNRVSDEYFWQEPTAPANRGGPATELEAADAPGGRGTEPEASQAPAGRGTELVGFAEPGTSANTEACEVVPRADRERG